MNTKYCLKLVTLFSLVFSLATLGGPLTNRYSPPNVQAVSPACVGAGCFTCATGSSGAPSDCWYPAGPEMSTERVNIFSNEQSEYFDLLCNPNPTIDFTDSPVPTAPCPPISQNPEVLLTPPVPAIGYDEIQFNLANTYWNCPFQFGNSACGVNIRQAFAHLMDKNIFAAQDPSVPPNSLIPIDNPVPTSSGGNLLSADSCLWDNSFPQPNIAASQCSVGGLNGQSHGGGAYHLASATGANGHPWLYAPGSWDLDAAAAHLVSAGLATGCDGGTGPLSCANSTSPVSTDSRLTGITATTCSTSCPSFLIRNDDPARLDLGAGLAAQICYVFTGTYGTPGCNYLTVVEGPATALCIPFTGCCPGSCNTPWIYTAAYKGPSFYDGSLYFTYNSQFVDGIGTNQIKGGGPCSDLAVHTLSPSNYMNLCNSNYDILSNQLETSPCLTADKGGDPVAGATSNLPTGTGLGQCNNGVLSSHSAAIQAENTFGQNVYTLPVFESIVQFGYLQCQPPGPCSGSNSWIRAINDAGSGLPNYFTWLNAYNPGPAQAGTIRQGFAGTTRSINPYIASTVLDTNIESNVYDSLWIQNPLNTAQFINWMSENTQTLTSVSYNSGGVTTPPPGTVVTYRFTLRPDLTFQDGRPVTSYDVAFSYLSLVGSGAFIGTTASTMSGITILNPRVFDIGVTTTGPVILPNLATLPIVPGRYWTGAGGASWDNAVSACTNNTCPFVQYTLSGSTVNCTGACTNFPSSLMTVNSGDLAATFDPIANHIMVGSGPWQCGLVTSSGSGTCTSTGSQNPPVGGTYTLTAYTNYFRSTQRLAIYLWSQESDLNAIGPVAFVSSCFNVPVNLAGPCGHYQQGAGNPNNGVGTCCTVSVTTVGNLEIFFNLNWLAPFEWTNSPPTGIAPLPPTLYGLVPFDGSTTYTPNPGGNSCIIPNTYYDC